MKCLTTIILFVLFIAPAALEAAPARLALGDGYRFIVIGDNRSGDTIYEEIVKGAVRREPAFIVNTGDLIATPGNRKQWKKFWALSKPITVPYYLTPGNHDINNEKSQQVWRDEVKLPGNETYYSFTVGKDLFVVLNTCDPKDYRRIAGQQFAWLKRTLNSKKYRHQFVFLHHPLFLWQGATHKGWSLDRYPEARDALHKLFLEKGVDMVFLGHEHTYKRLDKDGLRYVVTGGAGAPKYSKFNHFVVVEIDGELIAVKVVDKEGALRDEFYMGPLPTETAH